MSDEKETKLSKDELKQVFHGGNMDETKKQPKDIEQPAEPTLLSEAALEQVAGGTKTQADAGPAESVSFAYSKIKVSYEQQ